MEQPNTQLIHLDAFQQALVEAKTIPEVKSLADQADLFKQWLRKQRAGIQAQNAGAIMSLSAQRRLGEMLGDAELSKGAAQEGWKTQLQSATTLADLGIEKTASHRWQRLAEIPEPDFQEFIQTYQEVQDEITTAAFIKFWAKKTITPLTEAIPLPEGFFSVITCDPPWQYGTLRNPDSRRVGADYNEMSIEQLSVLDIPAVDDCVFWLWTTNAFMREALDLTNLWGFEQKTILTWFKDKVGVGYWLRGETEHCLLCTKGSPHKLSQEALTTHLKVKSTNHSTKPDEFYELVETLCGKATEKTHLEMFARNERKGWATWGNQIGQ